MKLSRPLLIGLHNPLSTDPRDALFPRPPGSTGHRLLQLLEGVDPDFGERDYLRAFDRANLWRAHALPTGRGASEAFKAEGGVLREHALEYADVVLLGTRVWSSVAGGRIPDWFTFTEIEGTRFWLFPLPSGVNRMLNMSDRRRRAGEILLKLARGREDSGQWQSESRLSR